MVCVFRTKSESPLFLALWENNSRTRENRKGLTPQEMGALREPQAVFLPSFSFTICLFSTVLKGFQCLPASLWVFLHGPFALPSQLSSPPSVVPPRCRTHMYYYYYIILYFLPWLPSWIDSKTQNYFSLVSKE